jgi:hypothetical protein
MPKFLANILNLLPSIIGIVQSLLPLIKELAVTVVRIIAILPFLWSADDPIIEKINSIYDKVYGIVEKIKNALLLVK